MKQAKKGGNIFIYSETCLQGHHTVLCNLFLDESVANQERRRSVPHVL